MTGRRLLLLAGVAGLILLGFGSWWIATDGRSSRHRFDELSHHNPAAAVPERLSTDHATRLVSDSVKSKAKIPEIIPSSKAAVAFRRVLRLRQEIERANTTLLTVNRTKDRLGAIGVVTAPSADQVASLQSAAQYELEQLGPDYPGYAVLQERLKHLLDDEFSFAGPKKLVMANYNYKDDTVGFGEFLGTDESGITYGDGGTVEIKAPEARYTSHGERYDYLLREAVEAEAAQRVHDAHKEASEQPLD